MPSATSKHGYYGSPPEDTMRSWGRRDLETMLKDGEKGKQAEGKACIKAQDKRKGVWDRGQQPLRDTEGRGDKAEEIG